MGGKSVTAAAAASALVAVTVASATAAATALLLLLGIGGEVDAEVQRDRGIGLSQDGQHLIGCLFALLKQWVLLDLHLDLLEAAKVRILRIMAPLGLQATHGGAILSEEFADLGV